MANKIEVIKNNVSEDKEIAKLVKNAINTALKVEGIGLDVEITVLFTDDEGIHKINKETRKVDAPTDVLSFPMFELTPGEKPTEEDRDMETGRIPLGDMVISTQRAKAQSEEFGHSYEREVCYLAVHSILHLLGYDHLDEGPMKKQMREREEIIMNSIGLER